MNVVGIDPGVATGLACWDTDAGRLSHVGAATILEAMQIVRLWVEEDGCGFVIFEDARKRKGLYTRADAKGDKYGGGVREGVGSIKRDCSIWEEFLTRLGVPFEGRYPHSTKHTAEQFERLTGWKGRTNEHGRDAAMIVYGMNGSIVRAKVIAFEDAKRAGTKPGRSTDRGDRARPVV